MVSLGGLVDCLRHLAAEILLGDVPISSALETNRRAALLPSLLSLARFLPPPCHFRQHCAHDSNRHGAPPRGDVAGLTWPAEVGLGGGSTVDIKDRIRPKHQLFGYFAPRRTLLHPSDGRRSSAYNWWWSINVRRWLTAVKDRIRPGRVSIHRLHDLGEAICPTTGKKTGGEPCRHGLTVAQAAQERGGHGCVADQCPKRQGRGQGAAMASCGSSRARRRWRGELQCRGGPRQGSCPKRAPDSLERGGGGEVSSSAEVDLIAALAPSERRGFYFSPWPASPLLLNPARATISTASSPISASVLPPTIMLVLASTRSRFDFNVLKAEDEIKEHGVIYEWAYSFNLFFSISFLLFQLYWDWPFFSR